MSEQEGTPSDAWRAQQAAEREKLQRQVEQRARVDPREKGGGSLFTERVLVVNQKAKLMELVTEHEVFDQDGNPVGFVAEVGQSAAKKVARFISSLDQFMTHTYEIRDVNQQPQLLLTRPRKFMKSSFVLSRPDGTEVGRVNQKNVFGKIGFSLEAAGREVGSLNAENWRAWDFNVQDASGREVARITKTWGGLGKAIFTQADNYVLEIEERLTDPLLSLVVATALCVDTALKQDARGLS
jgi:uncharacterized protein YxjI